jgi:cbb3-type cytochrome oxidase maturation protein
MLGGCYAFRSCPQSLRKADVEILYLLIPMSVALVFGVAGLLVWAVEGEQFDDLETVSAQLLDLSGAAKAPADTCEQTSQAK